MSAAAAQTDPAFQRLVQLAAAGVPVPEGLEAAAQEAPRRSMRRSLRRLAQRLRRGSSPEQVSWSDFDRLVTAYAAAGQTPQGWSPALAGMAADQQQIAIVRRSLWGAIVYPSLIVFLATLMAAIIGATLAGGTREFVNEFELSAPDHLWVVLWFHETVWLPLLGLGLLAAAALFAMRWGGARVYYESITRRLPLIGPAILWTDLAELSQAIARLLHSNLSYPETLRTARAATGSVQLRRWLEQAATRIEAGGTVEDPLEQPPSEAVDSAAPFAPPQTGPQPLDHWGSEGAFLAAMLSPRGPAGERPAEGWALGAAYFYRRARQRTELMRVFFPLAGYLVALAIGASVLYSAMLPMAIMVDLITGLG